MRTLPLSPSQIITLRDYPLHNPQILVIYFRIFSRGQGDILPPSPVIHKSVGIPFAAGTTEGEKKYNALLDKYLKNNPKVEYFLLDGSHKTTAATLACQPIPALVIERDKDLQNANELIERGELFGWYAVKDSIREMLDELTEHHLGATEFMTVADKTKKLIKNKQIPKYIIRDYHQKTECN